MQSLALIAILIPDYDEAIDHYTRDLDFTLVEDKPLSGAKRWVVVRPNAAGGTGLLLARAADARQVDGIGDQAGGRVFLFLHTDDFAGAHRRLLERGIRFLEPPRREAYGTVAVFVDRFGNKWDLIQPSDKEKSG